MGPVGPEDDLVSHPSAGLAARSGYTGDYITILDHSTALYVEAPLQLYVLPCAFEGGENLVADIRCEHCFSLTFKLRHEDRRSELSVAFGSASWLLHKPLNR